uniref:Venom protein n=1 Tax=Strongyloides papillosus TaxID=174720 RepID=A0A0N5B9T8_STREA
MKYIFASIVLSIVIFITINGTPENSASDTSNTTKRPNWQPSKLPDSKVRQCASDCINKYNCREGTNYTVGEVLKKDNANDNDGLLLRVKFNATFDCGPIITVGEKCSYDTFVGKCKISYNNSDIMEIQRVKNLTDTSRAKINYGTGLEDESNNVSRRCKKTKS